VERVGLVGVDERFCGTDFVREACALDYAEPGDSDVDGAQIEDTERVEGGDCCLARGTVGDAGVPVGSISMSPTRSSSLMASRIGVRDTPSHSDTASSLMSSPGCRVPSMMALRSARAVTVGVHRRVIALPGSGSEVPVECGGNVQSGPLVGVEIFLEAALIACALAQVPFRVGEGVSGPSVFARCATGHVPKCLVCV